MSTLKQLNQRRGQIKRQLSTFSKFLGTYTCEQSEQLRFRLERFEPILDEFNNVQSEIELLESEGEEEQLEARDLFEAEYYELGATAKRQLRLSSSTPIEHIQNRSVIEAKIKLPQLSLPRFSGKYEEWTSFADNFRTIIHDNGNLSDGQRFHYLRGQLSGAAEQAIQNLEATDANYKTAWDILKQRFENKQLAIDNYLRDILEFPQLTKENGALLRNICDTLVKALRGLKTLNIVTQGWDCILIYIIKNKLDNSSRREWMTTKFASDMPTTNELIEFLNKRCALLESLNFQNKQTNVSSYNQNKTHIKTGAYAAAVIQNKCCFCNEIHALYHCKRFQAQTVKSRLDTVSKLNVCFNCLTPGHHVGQCKSRGCFTCRKRHHSLLHGGVSDTRETETASADTRGSSGQQTVSVTAASATWGSRVQDGRTSDGGRNGSDQILLSTACAKAIASCGKTQICRVLLDSASQSNFITEELADGLRLQRERLNSMVQGIGAGVAQITHSVTLQLQSLHTDYNINIKCLVLPQITGNIPAISFDTSIVQLPPNIILADERFNTSNPVQILLGAQYFFQLLHGQRIELGKGRPILQNTEFGFILAGTLQMPLTRKVPTYVNCALTKQLVKFWEIEECEDKRLSENEQFCEELFTKTTTRDADGRFEVTIPLKETVEQLGNSREQALKRFYSLENRFKRNSEFKESYVQFMNEYKRLGHMTAINESVTMNPIIYYIPHHGIAKEDSLSSKHRTVFDASAKTDTNLSLNDVQYVGPVVQDDLFSILVRFRKHRYAVTADIQMMYRQVWIKAEQRNLQRIYWRADPEQELKCYRLETITYGMAASPYLATRCLKQLAIDNMQQYPETCDRILSDFYVDDFLSGGQTVAETKQLREEVTKILEGAKFNLRKWISNSSEVVERKADDDSLQVISLNETDVNKTLGLFWNPTTDQLQYKVKSFNQSETITKRKILSHISKLFDPLQILAPITITAKLIMQSLWKDKLSWDQPIQDQQLLSTWIEFQTQLQHINNIRVSRFISITQPQTIELHGFSDASERAYGACIYLRTIDEQLPELTYENKHQMILPANNSLTLLIAQNLHITHLHCGAQLLLSTLRQNFWPINGRNLTKTIVHKCVTCFRNKPSHVHYKMGDLPSTRVTPTPPFYECGTDFAGPYLIRENTTRGGKMVKAYVCLFVCFSTKAVHLELVGSLTSESFIAALRRFVGRRGAPNAIHSDNATNFVGAHNKLRDLGKLLRELNTNDEFRNLLLTKEIGWRFIPARAPNFGGLWERAVRSVKHHLTRVASEARLTFEEFYTLLVQVESVLNSRPLSPLTSNPDDLDPLTPGHFLIGRPLTAVMDEDLAETKINRLSRLQLVQRLTQHFWSRWKREYLLERITSVHPGSDDIVWVISIQTKGGG